MNYNKIKETYLEILEILNKFLLVNKDLEGDYYIDGAKNILTNKVNIYIDYTNFLKICRFFHPLLKEKLNILDLGCGLGDKAVVMKKIFTSSEVYGVETNINDDPSHKENPPYKIFERIYPTMSDTFDINLGLYDGYNLNFSDNTFDIAILYAIIEHISPEHRKNFIKTISQKVKKDGYIVITRCPRYYSLTEFIARKLKLGSHQWVLRRQELLDLFDKDLFDVMVFKRLSNIPSNPAKIMNKISFLLIYLDKFLNLIKWPFSSDYFLIVRKK